MADDLKKAFEREVRAAARSRYAVDVFADMVRAMAIAIESPMTTGKRHDELEDEFSRIRSRYEKEEFSHFPAAFALVMSALDARREDFLGHALEALGASNTRNGQFLTPVCVSRMMASVLYPKLDDYEPGQITKLNDPACGTSVLLIEGAERLISQGVRQDDLLVIAGDIDGRACDASYIQLSLLGYPAIVQHMDALERKRYSPDRYTPGYFLHCMPMRRPFRDGGKETKKPEPIDVRKLAQAEFGFD